MRLIDADDLIIIGVDNPDCLHQFKFVPKEFIDEAETIDAVPVVRCKDCKYADKYYHCTMVNWYQRGYDFCSRGKKKDNE